MTGVRSAPLLPCLVLVATLAQALGCASEGRPAESPSTQELSRGERLATIGIAQALLHETDVLEGLGDRAQAIERAEQVLSLGLASADPLRAPLRLDALGRIAELELAEGALDRADAAIARGLSEVRERSYFEARLYVVRGRVHEARAQTHRTAGDAAASERELRAALADHERSISINEGLLRGQEARP